jgi:hypothetical protein
MIAQLLKSEQLVTATNMLLFVDASLKAVNFSESPTLSRKYNFLEFWCVWSLAVVKAIANALSASAFDASLSNMINQIDILRHLRDKRHHILCLHLPNLCPGSLLHQAN